MNRKIKKMSNYKDYDEWVAAVLQEEDGADEYIKMAFEEYEHDGDEKVLLVALRQAAIAKGGIGSLSKKTGLSRENLYKALSTHGNPRFNTVKLVLGALGYRLGIQRQDYHSNAHSPA